MFGLAKDDLLELRDEIKGYQVGGSRLFASDMTCKTCTHTLCAVLSSTSQMVEVSS